MRLQVGKLGRCAMAIGAGDLDRRLDLAVDVSAAMAVLREVAVGALHAEIDMDRVEVHRLLELLGVARRNDVVAVVEQVAHARLIGIERPEAHAAKIFALRLAMPLSLMPLA